MDNNTPHIVARDGLLESLNLVGGSVFVVFIVDKFAKIDPVVDLPRTVDERIDRVVGARDPADDVDAFSGGFVQ
jgi:hypothetical protein